MKNVNQLEPTDVGRYTLPTYVIRVCIQILPNTAHQIHEIHVDGCRSPCP